MSSLSGAGAIQAASGSIASIFLVTLDEVDDEGFLVKREIADLLQIRDPHDIAGHGPLFRFAFQTIESVIPLSNTRLGVLDDNNYPFSNGRVPGQPDPTEFIIIRLDRPLVRLRHQNSIWIQLCCLPHLDR